MTVFCYPVPGKAKAKNICSAFAEGCGGTVIEDGRLRDGAAMFYGIMAGMEALWRAAHDGRDVWFCDNAYFDSSRQKYFRVTKNRLQHSGVGASDGKRFAALGIEVKPWRDSGKHIVLCPQSDHFMRYVAGYGGNWTVDTIAMLGRVTNRPIKVRPWSRDKAAQAASLQTDLRDAHAVVTWSSAAAVTAIVDGVSAVCANQSAAWPVAATIQQIEEPPRPPREQWCAVLADHQFTLDEMRTGFAWNSLNGK